MHTGPRFILVMAMLAVATFAPTTFAQVAPESQATPASQVTAVTVAPPAPATVVSAAPAAEAAAVPAADGIKAAALVAAPPPEVRRDEGATPAIVAEPAAIATPGLTAGQTLFNRTRDASVMDPVSWSVVIHKSRHELTLYYKGRLYRTYQAVFGRNLDNAAKEYEEDRRTPEGVYTIIKEYHSRRFHWFLRLNYPNFIDRERYHEMRADNVVPIDNDGWIPGVGGAIGIHGTDVPTLNQGLINWTTGCISVSNSSIDELHRLLPIGTVVIIKP